MNVARALSSRRGAEIALLGLTVSAFLLRLDGLDQSLYGDEVFTYDNTVDRPLSHVLWGDLENNPPLFYLLAWASAKLGDPTTYLRLPSLLLGTASVPMMYALGRRTVGAGAGLVGAAIVALSPLSIFYGVEARGYAALIFFSALATYSLLRALDTGRRRWWAVYAGSSLAVLYTHYLGVFVLLAQIGWALWAHPRRRRPLLLANLAVAVGCLPLIPALGGERVTEAPVTVGAVVREALRMLYGYPGVPFDDVPGRLALIALVAAAVAAAVAGGVRTAERPGVSLRSAPRPLLLLGALAIATPLGFFLYSLAGSSIALGRYLLPSLPALALLCGALVGSAPRPVSLLAACLAVVALAVGAIRSLDPQYQRPDFRGAARFIDREARPGDVIVDSEIGGFIAGQAFLSRGIAGREGTPLALYLEPERRRARVNSLTGAVSATGDRRRVFVVGPLEASLAPSARMPLRALESRTFPGVTPVAVRVYERTSTKRGASGAPSRRSVSALSRCLSRQGLKPTPVDAPPGAVARRLALSGGADGLVLLYPSPRTARRALGGVRRLVARHRGAAKRRGSVVVGYLGRSAERDRRRVELCL